MNRRRFLQAGLVGLGGASLAAGLSRWGAGSPPTDRLDALLAENFCATRAEAIIPAALPPRAPGELRYQGTHILTHGAFRELSAVYQGSHGARLRVWGGGCDDGITTVRRGSADLGGLCCPVKGSRAEGLPWLLVAQDIKVAVAHPSNPATDVSFEQLRAVARGRLANWKSLGGEDRAIALIVREHCPEYFEPVRRLLLDNRPEWSPRGILVDRDEQITDLVSRYAGGLGLVSWVFARPLAEAGRLKVLRVDGVTPDAAAVQNGHYRLYGPLSVIYRRWEAQTMRPFFDFLYGPQGRTIVARSLVPVSAEEADYRPTRWT